MEKNFFWFSMDKCEKKEEENALHWLEEGLKDLAPPLYEPPYKKTTLIFTYMNINAVL